MSPHLISRVTILGTGLIGGSFALALRKYTTEMHISGWIAPMSLVKRKMRRRRRILLRRTIARSA